MVENFLEPKHYNNNVSAGIWLLWRSKNTRATAATATFTASSVCVYLIQWLVFGVCVRVFFLLFFLFFFNCINILFTFNELKSSLIENRLFTRLLITLRCARRKNKNEFERRVELYDLENSPKIHMETIKSDWKNTKKKK